jgi:ATP-dependent DNA ligase
MHLEIHPPLPAMEAKSVGSIPVGDEWQYEPKWDGFRCLAFREDAKVELQSKSTKPLSHYFPELIAALGSLKSRMFVLDGEICVPAQSGFSFDALLQRIHPAASRVQRLALETPAIYVVFDLLAAEDGRSLLAQPLRERRRRLEQFAAAYLDRDSIRLSPATQELARSTVLQKARGQQSKPNAYATCKSRSTFPKKVHAKQPKHVKRYRCPDCAAKH